MIINQLVIQPRQIRESLEFFATEPKKLLATEGATNQLVYVSLGGRLS